MERKAFLDQEAPPGYIAGIGRGATGFTTRSDIGNARLPPQTRLIDDEAEAKFADAEGDESGLLSSVIAGNKEDEEADEIYKEIEDRLKKRSKRKIALIDDENQSNLQKISNQFVDLKKDLSTITNEEWANLPEVGDLTRRNKRLRVLEQQEQKTYAAPDSLLSGLKEASVNISELNSERHKLLGSKIDAVLSLNDEDSIDTNNYLNEISSSLSSKINEEDTSKLKTILNSYTKSDPKNPEGWIARARIEELDKKFENAKKLISQGCQNCSKNEDIWLENIRLNRYDLKTCKIIVTEAIKFNTKSLKLWLKAIELENEAFNKKRVIRKAIESIPTNYELWLKSIEFEDLNDDKIKILNKSIEIIPSNEHLWLKLIELQDNYEDSKKVLNRARKALDRKTVSIWIEAIKLESINNNDKIKLNKLIKKMIKDVELNNEDLFKISIDLEEKFNNLSVLIVENILEEFDETELKYNNLVEISENYSKHLFIYKTVLNFIVLKFPKKTIIWKKLIQLYILNFSKDELYLMFEKIIKTIPKTSIFWLMYSKQIWKSDNDIDKAKEILQRSFEFIPNNADIWLAIIKLETANKNYKKVLELYEEGLIKISNERINYKYITFLRIHDIAKAKIDVDRSISKFPNCFKLYLQKSQIFEHLNELNESREILSIGLKLLPSEIKLWKELTRIEISLKNFTRARSNLDIAILKNPESDELWLLKLTLELKLNNLNQLPIILNTALQKFPNSSLIWDFNLKYLITKKQRKVAYQDALNATNNDFRILLIIGINFWKDGKISKCKKWFERAIEMNQDYGDSWGWMYNCLLKEDGEDVEEFLNKFNEVEPRHGDIWCEVSKKLENIDKEPVEILKIVSNKLINDK